MQDQDKPNTEQQQTEQQPAVETPSDADLADFDTPATDEKQNTEVADDAAGEPAKTEAEPHKSPMIPKARFDEVNSELKEMRARLETLEQQRQQTMVQTDRDFEAERAELKKRYLEDGEIDRDEYYEAREAIAIAEAQARIVTTLSQQQQEIARQQAEQAWHQRISAWEQQNADFLANSIRRDAVANLLTRYGADPSIDNDALIAKVQAEAFEAFNWSGTSAPVVAPANPHAARNAADARAQAAASSVPSLAAAGSGDRGRKSFPGITEIPDADYKNLPKEVREAKDLANF